MKLRTGLVLAVVLVLGLAGCSGVSPFSSDVSPPNGFNESGITDAETAADQHMAALSKHDNYTQTMNFTSTESEGKINLSVQVDEANERANMDGRIEGEGEELLSVELYQDENMTYEKTDMPLFGTVYNTSEEPFSSFRENQTNDTDMDQWLANSSFEEGDTVTRDDETLYRYNATDVDEPDAFTNTSGVSNGSIDSFNATLLVDEEGIVRSFEFDIAYTADGETEETMGELRVTDVDSTTVNEPDWLEEAETAAQNDTNPFAGSNTSFSIAA